VGNTAEIFMHYKLMKVAVVVRPERLDPRRFGEMVMRNRRVNARVFTNVEGTEEWLLKDGRYRGSIGANGAEIFRAVSFAFEFTRFVLRNAAACPAVPTLFAVSQGQSA
jgi:hypothetical protein